MRTEFDVLDHWSGKKEVGMKSSKKEESIICIYKNATIINPDKFIGAKLYVFDPTDNISDVHKQVKEYLEKHNIEMFSIMCVGGTFNNLVKPVNISIKDFLEL